MQVFGHRGGAGEAPENTLAAIEHAIAQGISRFEIDLRLSADQQLVVLHDRSLARTAGIKKNVDAVMADELATLDARHSHTEWPSADHCGVPTLQYLLDTIPALDCIQLEVKSDRTTNIPTVIEQLIATFPDTQTAGDIVVTSFDRQFLANFKQQAPYIRIGLASKADIAQSFEQAMALDCDYLCLHYPLLTGCTSAVAETLTHSELHVSAWTVNQTEVAQKLRQLGVDSIITDYPSKMLSFTE